MAVWMETVQPARLPWLSQNNNIIIINNIAIDAHDPFDASTTATRPRHIEGHDGVIYSEHDYLRALIASERNPVATTTAARGSTGIVLRKRASPLQEIVSLPQSVVVSRGGGGAFGVGRGYRSFSLPTEKMMANVHVESVVENETSAPSSPPELSYSKSSKSSSSIPSDDELSDTSLTERSTHFEEVTLDDAGRDSGEDCNQPPDNRRTLTRPPPRSWTIGDVPNMKSRSRPTSPLGPLPNGMRQKYPSLQRAVSGVLKDQSLNLPNGRRNIQRAASNPTLPFMHHAPPRIPSRSPSPNKPIMQNGYCVSPQALASATPKAPYDPPKENAGIQRRPSWQPGRKTVEELEAEYNDEDEDVPEEAILENVPISPMPGQHHIFRSPSSTTLRSTTPSPQRRPSYANLHSAKIPKQAKRPSGPPPVHGHPRSPKNSRPPMPHSATVSAFPADPFNRKHRSQSWTEDLNEEARHLTQALEEYSEQLSMEKRTPVTNTPLSSPPRPNISKMRAKTSVVEIPSKSPIPTIPPVQKGNIMIDPLPISKEKEAVLTRTRPSWLPPKSQKEEKKHLREFQQMMARAAEAEKKRALKEQESRENREQMQGNMARIWEQHVIPNWDAVIRESRTREIWWRGVTPRNRGEVWQKAIGNELELSTTSFEAALARANALEEKFAELPGVERSNIKEAAWLDAIARDVPATFPELKMYHQGGNLHESLSNVLKAYAMYRSDVGYVYGTHLIAGVICLLLPASEAFVLLANMLNRPLPLAFLIHDQASMARAYTTTLQTLKYKLPSLHDHLTSPTISLKPEEFLDPIFRCLFAYNLPHEYVSRIWDIFVFEGDKTLIRAAVAVLGKLERKLYTGREGVLDLLGWRNEGRWDVGGEEDFVSAVREAGKVDERSTPGRSKSA